MLRGLLGVAGALGVAAISDKDGKMFPTSPLVPRLSGGRDSAEVMQELSKEQAQPLSPDPAAPRAARKGGSSSWLLISSSSLDDLRDKSERAGSGCQLLEV
ncbi:hypothetical protein TURU_070749 [Turdus rufiventris]|nr:hypothetical protein TURU_070749 [Turdus rufiventris]